MERRLGRTRIFWNTILEITDGFKKRQNQIVDFQKATGEVFSCQDLQLQSGRIFESRRSRSSSSCNENLETVECKVKFDVADVVYSVVLCKFYCTRATNVVESSNETSLC